MVSSNVDFLGVFSNFNPKHGNSHRKILMFVQDRNNINVFKQNTKLAVMFS